MILSKEKIKEIAERKNVPIEAVRGANTMACLIRFKGEPPTDEEWWITTTESFLDSEDGDLSELIAIGE